MSLKHPSTLAWALNDYSGPDALVLTERALPSLGPGQVLVEVEAFGLNPLDLKLMSGDLRVFMPVFFPFTPGSDVCGRIVEVGEAVDGYRIGDRVVAMTPMYSAAAQFVVCNSSVMAHVASQAEAQRICTLPEAGMTAMTILRAARIKEGDRVAVIGATGGVGLFFCQLAAEAGGRIVATGTAEETSLLHSAGASDVIDYRSQDVIRSLRAIWPEGPDVLVDLINQSDALVKASAAVRQGGRLVSSLMGPEPSAFGDIDVTYVRLQPNFQDLSVLVGLHDRDRLRVTISGSYTFGDTPRAYKALRDSHVVGKLVVRRP